MTDPIFNWRYDNVTIELIDSDKMIGPVEPPENVFLLNLARKGNAIVAVDPYEDK